MHAHTPQPDRTITVASLSEMEDPDAVARAILDLRHQREARHHHHHSSSSSGQQQQRAASRSNGRNRADSAGGGGANATGMQQQQAKQSYPLRRTQSLQQPPGAHRSGSPSVPNYNHSDSAPMPQQRQQQQPQQQRQQQQQPQQQPNRHSGVERTGSNTSSVENYNPVEDPNGNNNNVATPGNRRTRPFKSPQSPGDELLQKAENRIDGLLQELEDLRFFQEIDEAEPSPPATQKVLGAMKAVTPKNDAGDALVTPRGDAVPAYIRTSGSPVSPPVNHLSPRTISKMDRHSLELETQTLFRHIEILAQEKEALARELDVYKASSQQEQTQFAQRVRQLETHLQKVGDELRRAKADFQMLREQLIGDYEDRLAESSDDLQRSQIRAEGYKAERDKVKKEYDKRKSDYAQKKALWKDEMKRYREEAEAREAVLELQLGQANERIAEWKQQVADKQREIENLRSELAEAGMALVDATDARDEAYDIRIEALQQELALAREKLQSSERTAEQVKSRLKELTEQLEHAKKQHDEQLSLIADMTERLDGVHSEYRQKFSELKEVYETKEKRRLEEMVVSQSTETDEYERRLRSLQEQLTLATDRHHAEMKQKEDDLERRLEAQQSALRSELETRHDSQVQMLQDELEVARMDYEQVDKQRQELLGVACVPSPKADEELRREYEQKDRQREAEMARLRETCQQRILELREKDVQINNLSKRLSETESRHVARLSEIETQHTQALIEKDEVMSQQEREHRAKEVELRKQLAGRDAAADEKNALLESRITELQSKQEQAESSLDAARKEVEANQVSSRKNEELQASLDRLQEKLESERTAHESCEAEMRVEVAQLEGKLRASESSLKQKRVLIENLEEKLRESEQLSSSSTMELQTELEDVKKQLEGAKQQLQEEQNRESRLMELQNELHTKAQSLAEAQRNMSELQKKLADSEDERISQVVEANQLIKDLESATKRLAELEDEDRVSKFDALDELSSTVENLRKELDEERSAKEVLEQKLRSMESEVQSKEHEMNKLSKLQDKFNELIDGREELQETLIRVEAELVRKNEQLAEAMEQCETTKAEYESKLEENSKAKDAVQEQLRAVEAEVKMKEERAERIERQLPKIKADLSNKETTIEELRSKLSDSESELLTLKTQLREMTGTSEFSTELQSKMEHLAKAKDALEAKVIDLEEEREERERQVREASERYSNQILDLQMEVEELSQTKTSLASKLHHAEAELDKKEEMMSVVSTQLTEDMEGLHAKLGEQLTEKSQLERKLESLNSKLAEKVRTDMSIADERLSEVQSQLDHATKECRSLRLKIGDVEAELERKEKQIKDVVNRYSQEISGLKDKITEQSKANVALTKELDQLKEDSSCISGFSSDGLSMKDRLSALGKKVEVERALSRDADKAKKRLEQDLRNAESALEKANAERSEVISALEEVINEVQSREEEIDSLAHMLQKRDEELEHAKMIATKAIASAQDLKRRFKEKGESERNSNNIELAKKVSDLNASLQSLTSKNDTLQRRTSRLEQQLRAREDECAHLKAKLQKPDNGMKTLDDPFLSAPTFPMSDDGDEKRNSPSSDGLDSVATGSSSHSYESINDGGSAATSPVSSQVTSGSAGGWLQNFGSAESVDSVDNDNVSFSGIRSDPTDKSRRSIERDALRKYVRKRYLKSRGGA